MTPGEPQIELLPLDQERASAKWLEFRDRSQDAEFEPLRMHLNEVDSLSANLSAIFDLSPYLQTIAMRDTDFLQLMIVEGLEVAEKSLIDASFSADIKAKNQKELMVLLRKGKRHCALLCGIADLCGWWQVEKTCETLTRFADSALGATCRFLLREAHDRGTIALPDRENPEKDSGLIILAMGKHGAFELNYSSDIDIICLFDGNAKAIINYDEALSLYPRLAKQLAVIMQERTGDGYVFRTDLRLRPDPGSTPPALPVAAALNYYESSGQNWERAAHIKARLAAGDKKAGALYLKELTPFIWRKYLDFAAIADIHSIKRQIHAHRGHGKIAVSGHNLKLGRGGIREIEFFVQTQQLIAGGRVDELRGRNTVQMLEILHKKKWISQSAKNEMTAAYRFLRNVEHRLQMISDEQTHTMPTSEIELRRVALMCGFSEFEELALVLEMHMKRVESHYGNLFENEESLSDTLGNLVFTGDEDDPGTLITLKGLGYKRPSAISRIIRGWHFSRYRVMQTAEARERLTELLPILLQAFAKTSSADDAVLAFDRFLQGLPVGVQLFAMLKSNPELLRLLAEVLGIAPRLANIITRKPHVFDSLLEPEFFHTLPTSKQLQAYLDDSIGRARDYEDALDRARIFSMEQKFLIGVRYLGKTIDQERAGRAFSDLAEVLIGRLLDHVRQEFERIHGVVDGGMLAVIGMGRLGSRELTAGSDLDLILLYDHAPGAEFSNGNKPLATSQYFARMTQRLIAAMSAPTAEGTVYELDFRLRPSGNAGPLATNIDAYIRYQKSEAWTWEHMALTRARLVAGDELLVVNATRQIDRITRSPRDLAKLTGDVAEMRRRLEKEKPAGSIWEIKTCVGGLLDIDFIVQWAELAGCIDRKGELPETTGEKINRLQFTVQITQISPDYKIVLTNALILYQTIEQLLRLCLDGPFDPEKAPAGLVERLVIVSGLPDLDSLEFELQETRRAVRSIYDQLMLAGVDSM